MKKILIVAANMEIGGAERALLGLLDEIDTEKYQVDLFLMRHDGPFMSLIPPKIHLLPENPKYADVAVPIGQVIKKGHFGIVLGRTIGKFKAKRYIEKHHLMKSNSVGILYSFRYMKPFLPMISNEEYDLVIGFTICYYLIEEKTRAKKKVVWIHTDYSYEDADIKTELKAWSLCPHIVAVSDSVKEAFLKKYPSLRERVEVIENIASPAIIQKQAEMFDPSAEMPNDGSLKLLTIGRFSPQKKMEEIPEITKKIRELGVNVKWYIIGFGGEEPLIRQKIAEEKMEEYVIILGKKENPYPYIKACDVYVQPSRYEGKAVTVREAQMLYKPVIITNYPTAPSQFEDGVDGVIVPMEVDACAAEMAVLLKDADRLRMLAETCRKRDYSNKAEIAKIYEMMNEKNEVRKRT